MFEDFCWREKRCNLYKVGLMPFFIDTKKTEIPTGNAHYSMYGITKNCAKAYAALYTKQHTIYEHYSSEIIIDAETQRAVGAVLGICAENNWKYFAYKTGSGSGGAHIHIPREAEPSEHLYLQDKMLIERSFPGVPDIDVGIFHPMHLIRGIGRYHEETGVAKMLWSVGEGTGQPSVVGVAIYDLWLERHNRVKQNYKQVMSNDWNKFQNIMLRHNPGGITEGKRHVFLFCASKDLTKCGLNSEAILGIIRFLNSQLESPKSDEEVEKVTYSGMDSVLKDRW